jgi:hypothetical protein
MYSPMQYTPSIQTSLSLDNQPKVDCYLRGRLFNALEYPLDDRGVAANPSQTIDALSVLDQQQQTLRTIDASDASLAAPLVVP